MATRPPYASELATILFGLCIEAVNLISTEGDHYNANYRLDNISVEGCFNNSGKACACMNTRPAPSDDFDQRRIISEIVCWDCQSKMCTPRTCRRTSGLSYCDIYVSCLRLCICRCPSTRFGTTSHYYIPCSKWCDGSNDCPYGYDEPKGVYCAKRNYWSTIMPLSTIALVVILIFLCRQSIVRTINSASRRVCGRELFPGARRPLPPPAQQMASLDAADMVGPAPQQPLMGPPPPPGPHPIYPYDLQGYYHAGPAFPPADRVAQLPPPPPYESVVNDQPPRANNSSDDRNKP